MRIQHNIMSMNAYRNYNNNAKSLSGNLEKLSSGYKINRAGDDAAGLAISEKMRGQIAGLDAAQKNVKDGISLVKTAEGAMQEVQDMLKRMKYLATQSANGTYQEVDRKNLQMEVDELQAEIDRIGDTANFNGIKLLNGDWDAGKVTPPGGGANAALAASLDQTNAAKLGNVTVEFAADATDDQKAALNKALAGDIQFKTTDAGTAGTWDDGDKIQLDKLPTGYTATFVDATGADVALTAATDITVGSNAGELKATDDLKITLKDGDGKDVATITVGKPTAGATGTTTVTFKEADAAAGTKAVKAAGDANTAKKYESAITGDDGTNKLADNDTIVIGSKTYTIKAGGTGTDEIDVSTSFEDQLNAAITKYNAETGEDFTAAYADGKVTFTAKAGAADPDTPPTFTITDAAGKLSAGAPTEVKDENTTGGGLTLQIGDSAGETLDVSIGKIDSATLGIKGIDISTDAKSANAAIDKIKAATDYVSSVRGQLGAYQNRLEHTANNLSVMAENIQDAESTIRDTDVADEMMSYVKNNILVQSAQAMLAQANQVPQGVLQLLG